MWSWVSCEIVLLYIFKLITLTCSMQFLSMKLEAINAHVSNATVAFPTKDVSFSSIVKS
jgi:hypothetical protein